MIGTLQQKYSIRCSASNNAFKEKHPNTMVLYTQQVGRQRFRCRQVMIISGGSFSAPCWYPHFGQAHMRVRILAESYSHSSQGILLDSKQQSHDRHTVQVTDRDRACMFGWDDLDLRKPTIGASSIDHEGKSEGCCCCFCTCVRAQARD